MDILKSIQVFQQVAEDGSFTKAAEKMNLVPSAISRQISELERWLGVRLINRTTRSLHLTDDGKNYLLKMAEITTQVDDLKSPIEEQNLLTGKVQITAPIMLGQSDIPTILSAFQTKHPNVKIVLTLMNRKVDLIEEGYDLAIRAGHLNDSNFYAREIGQVAFKTVATKGYLQNRPSLNHPIDLRHHNCLINNAVSKPKRWTYKIDGAAKDIKVEGNLETNDSLCVLAFARNGLGIGKLPEPYVHDDLLSGDLIEVLNNFSPEPLPINIIYPSNRLMNHTLTSLINFIRQAFNNALLSQSQ